MNKLSDDDPISIDSVGYNPTSIFFTFDQGQGRRNGIHGVILNGNKYINTNRDRLCEIFEEGKKITYKKMKGAITREQLKL